MRCARQFIINELVGGFRGFCRAGGLIPASQVWNLLHLKAASHPKIHPPISSNPSSPGMQGRQHQLRHHSKAEQLSRLSFPPHFPPPQNSGARGKRLRAPRVSSQLSDSEQRRQAGEGGDEQIPVPGARRGGTSGGRWMCRELERGGTRSKRHKSPQESGKRHSGKLGLHEAAPAGQGIWDGMRSSFARLHARLWEGFRLSHWKIISRNFLRRWAVSGSRRRQGMGSGFGIQPSVQPLGSHGAAQGVSSQTFLRTALHKSWDKGIIES